MRKQTCLARICHPSRIGEVVWFQQLLLILQFGLLPAFRMEVHWLGPTLLCAKSVLHANSECRCSDVPQFLRRHLALIRDLDEKVVTLQQEIEVQSQQRGASTTRSSGQQGTYDVQTAVNRLLSLADEKVGSCPLFMPLATCLSPACPQLTTRSRPSQLHELDRADQS